MTRWQRVRFLYYMAQAMWMEYVVWRDYAMWGHDYWQETVGVAWWKATCYDWNDPPI